MINLKVSFNPHNEHINQIHEWITSDEKRLKDGLQPNWNYILEGFSKNRAAIALSDCSAVGFAVWKPHEADSYSIDFLQIKSNVRKLGIGTLLVSEVEEMLIRKGALMVFGNSINENSDSFWLKMGNSRLAESQFDRNRLHHDEKFMFKILVDTLQPNLTNESQETLELWENEDYRINEGQPANFVWALEFKPGSRILTKPIVVPAEADWMVRWSRNGHNLKHCQVKRFPQNESTGHFLIVRKLPE